MPTNLPETLFSNRKSQLNYTGAIMFFDTFLANLKKAFGHYSSYVVWVGAFMAAYWFQASPADQDYWLSFIPFIDLENGDLSVWNNLFIFAGIWFAAKGWPQDPPADPELSADMFPLTDEK